MAQLNRDLDFEGLRLVFRRTGTLPQLPGSALRLLEAIDSGEASARDLERIITCDAGLTANLLRLANSAETGLPAGITTVRAAIMRLGQRSVRSMAVSLTIQGLLTGDSTTGPFKPERYAKHSVAVGFLCRYVFARRKQKESFETKWSTDEVFAAGLLHDIGHALLAKVAPGVYGMICNSAEQKLCSVNTAFHELYGHTLGSLGSEAANTWGLPKLLVPAILHAENPMEAEDEHTALACIHYSNYLAGKMNMNIESWHFEEQVDAMVDSDVGLSEEEVAGVLEIVRNQTEAYLHSSGCMAA